MLLLHPEKEGWWMLLSWELESSGCHGNTGPAAQTAQHYEANSCGTCWLLRQHCERRTGTWPVTEVMCCSQNPAVTIAMCHSAQWHHCVINLLVWLCVWMEEKILMVSMVTAASNSPWHCDHVMKRSLMADTLLPATEIRSGSGQEVKKNHINKNKRQTVTVHHWRLSRLVWHKRKFNKDQKL